MNTAFLRTLGTASALAIATAACVSDPNIPRTAQSRAYHFNDMDGNGDDRLVPSEIEEHLVLYRDFAYFDSDNNGWIGRGEFDAYLDTMEDR